MNTTPKTLADRSEVRQAIRKVLKHHKLTKHGDGVVEADLAHAVADAITAIAAPQATAPQPSVGEQACSHVWNDFGQLGGRNVSWCPRCDTLAWTGKEPAIAQGASSAPLSGEEMLGIAAPYFAWNAESWREATQGTIGMPALLNYTRAVNDAAIARHSASSAQATPASASGELLTDQQIKDIAFDITHGDHQNDPHGYDIALARAVERHLRRAPSPSREEAPAAQAVEAPAGIKLRAVKGADTKQWHVVVEHPFGTSWVKMGDPRDIKLAELLAAAPAASVAQNALDEYQPGQWWLERLEALWGKGESDDDTRRAAKVACNFAAAVFASRGAASVAQAENAVVLPRELAARCLSSMRHAVTFGDTGQGRPPSQTCMFEIEELQAILSSTQHSAKPLTSCAAGRDGECAHPQCPQLRDGEPARSGRHCPIDIGQGSQP